MKDVFDPFKYLLPFILLYYIQQNKIKCNLHWCENEIVEAGNCLDPSS